MHRDIFRTAGVKRIGKAIRPRANVERDSRMPRKEDTRGDKMKCLLSLRCISWRDCDANKENEEKCFEEQRQNVKKWDEEEKVQYMKRDGATIARGKQNERQERGEKRTS